MVGKQSTLNDVQSIDAKASAANSKADSIKKEMGQRGLLTRMQVRKTSDMNNFFENGRFSLAFVNEMKNQPPRSRTGSYNWFYCDMKVHAHSNGHALTEVTEFFRDRKFFRRQSGLGGDVRHGVWVEYLTTANTIVDVNGFIKSA